MFLMRKFHEFYAALIGIRAELQHGGKPDEAHDRLVSLLAHQEAEAQRELGSYGSELYARAKYPMAALADEILLPVCRDRKSEWMLLETALFRTQCAGEKVFDNIDNMRGLGSHETELARVYLAVLGLGFQGYFCVDRDPNAQIEHYRKKLFALAYGRGTLALEGRRPIAPAAYESTLIDGESRLLPHLKPWIYALILLAVFYAAAGAALWRSSVADLDPIVVKINKTTSSPERTP